MASKCPVGVDCSADLGPTVAPVVSPILALAILALIGRLYCRRITGQLGTASDYTIVGGMVMSMALSSMILYSPRLGMGEHVAIVPLDQLEKLLISLYVGCILYAVAIAVIKISILLLYRSLFPTPGIDLATKIIGAISIAWGVETALVGTFSCTPVKAFWDVTIKDATCINTTAFFIANSTFHVIIDIAILILPIRKVWGLKMSLRHKVVVSFMFLLGGFICIIGIVRLFFVATLNMADPTYSLYDTYIWSSVEANVGVICACLPTLRPLFIKLLPKGDFGSRAVTAPPVYFEYGTDSHRQRLQRHGENNFERLHDYQLGRITPSVTSRTAIVITHEVEQEREVGKMSMQEHEQQMWSKYSTSKAG